jgi:hypothetical protein
MKCEAPVTEQAGPNGKVFELDSEDFGSNLGHQTDYLQ